MKLFSVICFLIITINYSGCGEGGSGNVLGDIQSTIVTIVELGLQSAIIYRQRHHRSVHGEPEETKHLALPKFHLEDYDMSFLDSLKSLIDYGFLKFGFEVWCPLLAFSLMSQIGEVLIPDKVGDDLRDPESGPPAQDLSRHLPRQGGQGLPLRIGPIREETPYSIHFEDALLLASTSRAFTCCSPWEMAKLKKSPMSDSNNNDAPIIDVSPVITPVKTSKNDLRTVPISFESQAILYLFPQKYHRGTAKVMHFYQKDICYILSGDEACHQNESADSCKPCIDYTPLSAMTYLPPDWCICFSDEYDCSGYNACWQNFGYPVDLSYDGFKHIRSISILSGPVCKEYHVKKLSRPATPNIEGLECHPTRQNNVIGNGSDDYSMVQSPNLPSPYIRPNHNHMILQLFDRKLHTGEGTVLNFFKGDTCYNIKTCNITSPSSAYVYAPKCWSVCFSKDEDCKGLTKCWPNYGWPIDLHYDGLAGLKSFALYDTGCYGFSRPNITETQASKIAESCV
ncbi:hypothetical protein WR25_26270 [Diploscapter pachys]|uniref:Uncharacterized protein n=1 Tax=Diploscapter pachys TaxID=2018661 RepID=A0A2A2JSR9_9BILA|nr:hypothetical protein WR25_26270 [Diploscapter pachys]